MDGATLVTSQVGDGVATIVLDSADNRNALSGRLLAQLAEALSNATAAADVHALVLTGTGTVFCSGADLSDPPSNDPDRPFSYPDVLRSLSECPKPTLARVNGHARAGGLGLVAACDIAVGPADATFAFSEVRLGLVPAIIAVVCQRVMPARAFAHYTLTGEVFDGAAAAACGLLTHCVPAWELEEVVSGILAALHQTEPNAVAMTKQLIAELPTLPTGDAFARAAAISVERFESAEGREGIAAFREKRRPSWAW